MQNVSIGDACVPNVLAFDPGRGERRENGREKRFAIHHGGGGPFKRPYFLIFFFFLPFRFFRSFVEETRSRLDDG